MKRVAIVLGTYNRLPQLRRAIASIRAAVGAHPYRIIVCDGGSTDGTREYLGQCADVQRLPGGLNGAVQAFNEGFAWAVEWEFDYVCHLNDDAEILSDGFQPDVALEEPPIADAIRIMERSGNEQIGEVAFEMDLRGGWGWEKINGAPYANFGVVRRQAGMAVAEVQGDPTGCAWWNPIYRTYGADCEFGCNLWRLGWHVYPADGLRVHDANTKDALRDGNEGNNKNGDSDLFWSRWKTVDLLRFVPAHILALMQPPRTAPLVMQIRRRRGRENPEYKK